ncbi:Hypothetical protein Tpal_233 [Trichococcus palustris]|uniref:Uncharacterized protein n=1 Tax=Trichococcus palustris TaxID=140314 RepID=A0A143Y7F4_9LACT|nr:hypothetical protein [Trichococcus palustris]CZQ81720.1 Hypothetical protein Tpal_233 [Trichococcus palustris]SFK61938.1 hypothetical protein SAMN04488076_10257 [Trichococcus palustris]
MPDTELEQAIKLAVAHLNKRIKEEQANISNLQSMLATKLPAKKYSEYVTELARSEGAINELHELKVFLSALAGTN